MNRLLAKNKFNMSVQQIEHDTSMCFKKRTDIKIEIKFSRKLDRVIMSSKSPFVFDQFGSG